MPTDMFVTYEFHSDAGHGWLKVPVKDYNFVSKQFGWKATPFSYRQAGFVYLEEDQDCNEFVSKMQALGYVVNYNEIDAGDWSPIRNFAPLS